jgi:hypothetical protein
MFIFGLFAPIWMHVSARFETVRLASALALWRDWQTVLSLPTAD